MDVPLFIVDAFTTRAFSGNPAAVCVLDAPMPEAAMQAVAAEMNLSETAFACPKGGDGRYGLRWFTPAKEVPLCGHATLATAAVLRERGERAPVLRFDTLSGELRVADDAAGRGGLTMDFPLDAPRPYDAPKALLDAVGAPAPVLDACVGARSGNVLLRLPDEAAVRAARPDPRALLAAAHVDGVILTARGRDAGVDFVSRYFTPWYGIDEDPVTGSSHTLLGPYWARETGRDDLRARQVSTRGGEMGVRMRDDGRVELTGHSVVVLRGTLKVDG